ncbi:MAG: hypothetical protein AAB391_00360 [Patescibacteria group bacterium]
MSLSLGLVIVLIVVLGYASNWLNWQFLNYRLTHALYYIGAFVHESSHALLCLATGAKIEEFKVFSYQPHVIHRPSRLPILGALLISAAPIAGGLAFLYAINHFLLDGYFIATGDVFAQLTQLNPFHWQSWVMILLCLNAGAMLGPSPQDIKNIWPLLILLFFVQSNFLMNIGLAALSLIVANIAIQLVLILLVKMWRIVRQK